MRVKQFWDLCPDLAARQMVMFWLPPRSRVPVKCYWLFEYYCDEPGCDCRRVLLDAVSSDQPGRVFASIHFGWETLEFYRRWTGTRDLGDARPLKKGVLDPSDFNCDWADVLLKHVRKEILANPKSIARFKKHYEMVKRAQRKRWKRTRNGRGAKPHRA